MYNIAMKEIFLNTCDNIKIAINHHKTGHKEVIVLVHGWFMTKDSKAFRLMVKEFKNDFDVISMDCRGHGRSSGFYTFTAKEVEDLRTVVNYAKGQYEKIYLIGFSLGGGLVLIHQALENNVDKIISVSSYHSFEKIENHMWKKEAWIPTLKKIELKRWFSIRPSCIIRGKIKPIDIVEKINIPTLFIAGEKDPTVYYWHTKSLYDKAVCEKKFELFKNGKHAEDLYLEEPERFMELCKDFLKVPVHSH